MAESPFASPECELIDQSSFRNHAEARAELFRYIEGRHNTHRRHSTLGYCQLASFEISYAEAT